MIDFHTHILPNFDDGAADLDMSLKMIDDCFACGTDMLVSTSHFYPRTEEEFLKYLRRRKRRIDTLSENLSQDRLSKIYWGAEVNMHTDFSHFDGIKELCISGTDYLMVEMPPGRWDEWMFDCLYNLTLRGIKIVIAHIDRYLNHSTKDFMALDEVNPVYQVNADGFLSFVRRRKVGKLFLENHLHILGSDMHNTTVRKNNLNLGYEAILNKFGSEYCDYIENNGEAVLKNLPLNNRELLHQLSR